MRACYLDRPPSDILAHHDRIDAGSWARAWHALQAARHRREPALQARALQDLRDDARARALSGAAPARLGFVGSFGVGFVGSFVVGFVTGSWAPRPRAAAWSMARKIAP